MEKILIVDDQTNIRALLSVVLTSEGYVTFQASSGEAALEIVEKERPDILITDLKMPGMDGLELVKQCRLIRPHMILFMMTAYGELDIIAEARRSGVVEYFPKPFDIDEVRQKIKPYTRLHQES